MMLFFWTIPLMMLAVLVAAVPLVVVSRREAAQLVHDAEMRFERHRRRHPERHRTAHGDLQRGPSVPSPSGKSPHAPWYKPVLLVHSSRPHESETV